MYITEMSRKSKNNRRCTQGKFTENPKQYLLFCRPEGSLLRNNRAKYDHIIDRGLITVVNRSGEIKAIFNYEEVCRYLHAMS